MTTRRRVAAAFFLLLPLALPAAAATVPLPMKWTVEATSARRSSTRTPPPRERSSTR